MENFTPLNAVLGAVGVHTLTITDNDTEVGTPYCSAVPNSTGAPSSIMGIGSAVASDNDLTLVVTDLPVGAFGFFVVSAEQIVVLNPGGSQGNLCNGSFMMARYSNSMQTADSNGLVSMPLNLAALPFPGGAVSVAAGETWNWQLWHRDSNPDPTSNFSNALAVTFQ